MRTIPPLPDYQMPCSAMPIHMASLPALPRLQTCAQLIPLHPPPGTLQGAAARHTHAERGEVRKSNPLTIPQKASLGMPIHMASLVALSRLQKCAQLITLHPPPRTLQGTSARHTPFQCLEMRQIKALSSRQIRFPAMPMHPASLAVLLWFPKCFLRSQLVTFNGPIICLLLQTRDSKKHSKIASGQFGPHVPSARAVCWQKSLIVVHRPHCHAHPLAQLDFGRATYHFDSGPISLAFTIQF